MTVRRCGSGVCRRFLPFEIGLPELGTHPYEKETVEIMEPDSSTLIALLVTTLHNSPGIPYAGHSEYRKLILFRGA